MGTFSLRDIGLCWRISCRSSWPIESPSQIMSGWPFPCALLERSFPCLVLKDSLRHPGALPESLDAVPYALRRLTPTLSAVRLTGLRALHSVPRSESQRVYHGYREVIHVHAYARVVSPNLPDSDLTTSHLTITAPLRGTVTRNLGLNDDCRKRVVIMVMFLAHMYMLACHSGRLLPAAQGNAHA